jgi:hypothetical protein
MERLAVERRRNRSQTTTEAIELQLEHLAETCELEHLVLADSSGLMLSCSGPSDSGQALAAYAPVFRRHLERGKRRQVMQKLGDLLPGVSGQTLSVRRFRLNDEPHYLCVVGPEETVRQANLYRAVTGIRRIVDETTSAA